MSGGRGRGRGRSRVAGDAVTTGSRIVGAVVIRAGAVGGAPALPGARRPCNGDHSKVHLFP